MVLFMVSYHVDYQIEAINFIESLIIIIIVLYVIIIKMNCLMVLNCKQIQILVQYY